MPTATGGDTISERLTKLRAELVRIEATIARSETNGASFAIGGSAGTQVTVIAYDRALKRRGTIRAEILELERRLGGGTVAAGMAVTRTRLEA